MEREFLCVTLRDTMRAKCIKEQTRVKDKLVEIGIGNNQVYALKDREGNVITNRDNIVIVVDEFYRYLYSSHDMQDNTERGCSSEEVAIQPVTIEEVNKAWKEMQGGKAPAEDQIKADF